MSTAPCPIEHIIVVMLENRSYDNVLGGLYLPTNDAPYDQPPPGQADLDGLADIVNNSPPTVANQTWDTQVGGAGAFYPPTTIPVIDPGEFFSDMAQQILGLPSVPILPPYDNPAQYPPDEQHAMQGFVTNYSQLTSPPAGDNLPVPTENRADVMNYFTPAQLPVTAWLANNFAVCDQWFASAPTQTFTNRAFAHCAAPAVVAAYKNTPSYSLINDSQYIEAIEGLSSVFSQLDAVYGGPGDASPPAVPNWKVYFHDYSISMLTVPYVMEAATKGGPNVNVATYDDSDWVTSPSSVPNPLTFIGPIQQTSLTNAPSTFLEDLANNTLPMYSFIEPRYSNGVVYDAEGLTPKTITPNSYPPNSNHPGAANYPSVNLSNLGANPVSEGNPPIDAADGEDFLMGLYNALCQSEYWKKSLLIITYDEHGGLYDHVVPPRATPPGNAVSDGSSIPVPPVDLVLNAANGFNFNVFGCRVPTIIVSPYIAPGTTIRAPIDSPPDLPPFDHTSIIKTVWDCFNLSATSPPTPSLTDRDLNAPSLLLHLTSLPDNNPGPYPASPPY